MPRWAGGGCWTPPGLDRGGYSSLVARTKFFHGNSCLSQDGNLFDLGRTLAGDVPFSPGPVRESGGPDSPPIPATGAVQEGGVWAPWGGHFLGEISDPSLDSPMERETEMQRPARKQCGRKV